MQKEQTLGAGFDLPDHDRRAISPWQELDLATAMTVYEKAKVELDRAIGSTWKIMESRFKMRSPAPPIAPLLAHANLGQTARSKFLDAPDESGNSSADPGGRRSAAHSEAIELLLRPQGYKVDVVRSPEMAREVLASAAYDAVLIDLNYSRDTTSDGRDLICFPKSLRSTALFRLSL